MTHKNIYKVDNYLISIGSTFLIIGILFTVLDPSLYHDLTLIENKKYDYLDYNGKTVEQIKSEHPAAEISEKSFPFARVIIAANGLIMLLVGMDYRRKEKRIIQVWDALDRTGEAKINDLAMSLGLTREFVIQSVKTINAQPNAYFVVDSSNDKIVDGSLMTEYAFSSTCTACGNGNNYKIALSFSTLPKCHYCGTPFAVEKLNELKHKVLSSREVIQPAAQVPGEFKVWIFVVLLIFFWPAAIVYLIMKKSKSANVRPAVAGDTVQG